MHVKRRNGAVGWRGFEPWLLSEDGGCCTEAKRIGDGTYAAIKPPLFHWTLIVGIIGDESAMKTAGASRPTRPR
jgi:hypothetical protein